MRADTPGIAVVAARWMIVSEWRAHPWRVAVGVAAIAIGVALGFAVHLINASALNEFTRAVRTVNGDSDLQVHSTTPLGFDESLYPKLARLAGIAGASAGVEISGIADGTTSLTLIGLDVLRAGTVTPSLVGRAPGSPLSGETVFDETALFLSDAALRTTGKHIGDELMLTARGRSVNFVIAGTLPGAVEGEAIGVVDIAAAQWRFDLIGRLQRIDLKLAEGADPTRIRDVVAATLPPEAEMVSRESEARRTDSLSSAYRVNLDMLALVALLTGAFLVFSAQSLSVARRRAQFALLRVLGVQRRALVIQLLAEGAILGTAGAALGLGLGLAIAAGALAVFGGDLGSGYFRGVKPALIFTTGPALVFLSLGIAAALIGSLMPALEAARAQPAIALKNAGDTADPNARPPARTALLLLALGTASAFLPAIGGVSVFGYLSMGFLLAGGVCAMPLLARMLLAPMQRLGPRAPAIGLALRHLWGSPSQAAIALCGIVASTSLMIAMAVMVTSFRASVEEWLIEVLPADVYLHVDGDEGGVDRETQERLRASPGIAGIDFRKLTPLRLSSERPPIALLARAMNKTNPASSLPLIGASLPIPGDTTPVWVSEPAAGIYHYRPGDFVELPIAVREAGRPAHVFVAGIWRDYARQQGAIAIDSSDYTRLTGDDLRTDAAILLQPGAATEAAMQAIRDALPPVLRQRVTIADPRRLRAISLGIFDRSFAVTYVLEAIAILVGLAGVAATVSAQTLVRSKEFGMLRHIGVTKAQIVAMLLTEGAFLGAIGVVAGIGLGLAMSQVLIHVVNPQSFHWTMETHLPVNLFAAVAAALIAAASGTALVAGQFALSTEAVRAVREDW
jgi:putative ABC transport system permease protein